jgi:hypothetical protein
MKTSTLNTINELKENNENNLEWYPTTYKMLDVIYVVFLYTTVCCKSAKDKQQRCPQKIYSSQNSCN